MLLSEAIRAGKDFGPQLRNKMQDTEGGSCALGGAMRVMGIHGAKNIFSPDPTDVVIGYLSLKEFFNTFPTIIEHLPSYKCNKIFINEFTEEIQHEFSVGPSLQEIITQQNDHLGWSRDKIADWIVENGFDCQEVDEDF